MGHLVETSYDRAGRVTETRFKQSPGASASETRDSLYDHNGNLLSRTDLNGVSTLTYDALNRLSTESRTTSAAGLNDSYTVGSSYDADGNRTMVQYPSSDGVLHGHDLISHYDSANRLIEAEDAIAPGPFDLFTPTTFTYDLAGNRLSETSSSGRNRGSS